MNLARLRWLAVVIPVGFLAGLDLIRHELFYDQLHSLPGAIVLFAIVTAAVCVFSWAVFRAVDVLQRRIVDQNRQLSALARISAASAESPELADLLRSSLDQVLSVTGADAGAICLLDTEAEELVASCYQGFSDELAKRIQRQKLSADPVGSAVVRTGLPVVIEQLLSAPETADVARQEGFQSAISVPLKAEGEVSGVLAVASRQGRRFPPGEVDLLTNIGAQLGLAVRNAMLFAHARQRNEELAALLAVGRAATSSLTLTGVLDEALRAIASVTSADVAEIWLMESGEELRLERAHGDLPFHTATRLAIGEGIPGTAAQTRSLVVIDDVDRAPSPSRESMAARGCQSCIALPLRGREGQLGVLVVASRSREALCSLSTQRLLAGIGEQIAIALENARLHERVLDVAVLEERERIARELHDGVGQLLGYVNTQTLAVRKLVASGRSEEAADELRAMEGATREVYGDVREAILGLRTSFSTPGGLVPNLRSYIERYSEMSGIAADLDVSEAPGEIPLPAPSELQLMRIVQEALTNVRKHAGARSARVTIRRDGDDLVVEIRDDGRGFDPSGGGRSGWPRFGLQTMQERAEAIGGTFAIASVPEGGTCVVVRVPLCSTEEVTFAGPAR